MAPAKGTAKTQTSEESEASIKSGERGLLYSVLAHIQGEIEFSGVAADIGVPNAEAARKRLKRFLTKEGIEATVKGSRIGDGGNELATDQATNTPAKKSIRKNSASKKEHGESGDEDKQKKGGAKVTPTKRKAKEMESEQVKTNDKEITSKAPTPTQE